MNQMLTIGQPTLTTSNIEYNAYLKSNYANYPSNTSTINSALIDVLDGALLWIGEIPQQIEIDTLEERIIEI